MSTLDLDRFRCENRQLCEQLRAEKAHASRAMSANEQKTAVNDILQAEIENLRHEIKILKEKNVTAEEKCKILEKENQEFEIRMAMADTGTARTEPDIPVTRK